MGKFQFVQRLSDTALDNANEEQVIDIDAHDSQDVGRDPHASLQHLIYVTTASKEQVALDTSSRPRKGKNNKF
jgi:hypothetical protein